MSSRLRFFDHTVRNAPNEDHHRAVAATIRKPVWLETTPQEDPTTHMDDSHAIESDLRKLNICPSSHAWKKESSRENWRSIVYMTKLNNSMPLTDREFTEGSVF